MIEFGLLILATQWSTPDALYLLQSVFGYRGSNTNRIATFPGPLTAAEQLSEQSPTGSRKSILGIASQLRLAMTMVTILNAVDRIVE